MSKKPTDKPQGTPIARTDSSGSGGKDQPPANPLFDNAPGGTKDKRLPDSIGTESERARIEAFKKLLPQLKDEGQRGGRAQRFYPYLLVRSLVGDRGDRPINVPFWESPDIWTAPGAPAASPAIPANPGGVVTAGEPNTVYAHVWNLGRAPIMGVKVEYYWFNPTLGINAAHANLIGVARVDLGPRNSTGCHRLVKCPKAWVPVVENNGHECLVVRVSAIGDNISATHPWDAWADRHVAQRNIHVASQGAEMAKLITSLNATLQARSRVQLLQVGAEAAHAVQLVAPHLKLDQAVRTHVLAEMRADGSVFLPATRAVVTAGQPAVHTAAPIVHAGAVAPLAVPRVIPNALLNIGAAAVQPPKIEAARTAAVAGGPIELLPRGGNVGTLLNHASLISPEVMKQIQQVAPPKADTAQVLRVASFVGDQLVGGYTIVIKGRG
jgi:hypothetical protein